METNTRPFVFPSLFSLRSISLLLAIAQSSSLLLLQTFLLSKKWLRLVSITKNSRRSSPLGCPLPISSARVSGDESGKGGAGKTGVSKERCSLSATTPPLFCLFVSKRIPLSPRNTCGNFIDFRRHHYIPSVLFQKCRVVSVKKASSVLSKGLSPYQRYENGKMTPCRGNCQSQSVSTSNRLSGNKNCKK